MNNVTLQTMARSMEQINPSSERTVQPPYELFVDPISSPELSSPVIEPVRGRHRKPSGSNRTWSRDNIVPLVWKASDEPETIGRHRKENRWDQAKRVGVAAVAAIGLFAVASPDVNEKDVTSQGVLGADRMDVLAPSSKDISPKSEAKPTPQPEPTPEATPEWETIPQVKAEVISEVELPNRTVEFLNQQNVAEKARDPNVLGPLLYASEQTGVPVEALLALKYREIGPSLNPETSLLDGEPLNKASGVSVDGHKIHNDPYDDALYAAKLFIELAAIVPEDPVDITKPIDEISPQDWGVAFLRYNRGTLYRKYGVPYTRSPYSMNGLDDNYMDMRWPGGNADPGASTRGGSKDGNPVGALAAMVYFEKLDLPKSTK